MQQLSSLKETRGKARSKRDLPPLAASVIEKLRYDSKRIVAVAADKNLDASREELENERRAAENHFELGCWLFYYSQRIHRSGAAGLMDRIDCARRIFEAGIKHPYYDFHTVFEFGDREFRTLFSVGDKQQVLNALRPLAQKNPDGGIAAAFTYFGWPLAAQPELFQH
jgi:hypothetical protein